MVLVLAHHSSGPLDGQPRRELAAQNPARFDTDKPTYPVEMSHTLIVLSREAVMNLSSDGAYVIRA